MEAIDKSDWTPEQHERYDRLVRWAAFEQAGNKAMDAIEGEGPQERLLGFPVEPAKGGQP